MPSTSHAIAFVIGAKLSSTFGKTIEKVESRFNEVSQKLGQIGANLSAKVTLPLVAIGRQALVTGADFENSLGSIQARTGMTSNEVESLGQSMRNLAISGDYGAFTAREIANAYSEIAVAGQGAEHATEIMRQSMVLATAVGDSLGNTSYFLGNYLLKVGKDASYAEKYINLFAATNQRTGIGLNTLQDYLFRANASLNMANISGTEATAVFGQLYQAGVRGANAYSGFQQAITTMLLPTEQQSEAFRRLGISTDSTEWQSKSTMEQFFALGDAMENVTDSTERLDLMQTLFTQQSALAFSDELFNQRDALREIIPELYEVTSAVDGTGIAYEMAAIQQDGLQGSVAMLRVSFEEFMLQISTHLMPKIQAVIGFISNLINRFTSLDESTQRFIVRVGLLAAAIGPVLIIAGKIVKTVGKIHKAFTTLKTTITAVKTAQQLQTAATIANTKAQKINEVITNATNKATMLRKAAVAAETKAVKLALVAEGLRNTKGATAAQIAKAQAAADTARATATAASVKATTAANLVEKVRTGMSAKLTAAINLNNASTNANTLANSKLGKSYALLIGMQAKAAAALKGKTLAMKLATIGKGILTLGVKGLSVAFKAMSVAIMKIPVFGWILAAITALVAGIALLVRWLNRVGEEYQAVGEEADRLREQQETLLESSERATSAFNHELRVLQAQSEQYEHLANCIDHATTVYNLHRNELDRLSREYIEMGLGLEDTQNKIRNIEAQLSDGSNRRRRDTRALNDALDTLRDTEAAYIAAMEANRQMQADLAEDIEVHADVLAYLERQQQEAAYAMAQATAYMEEQMRKAEEWEQAQTQALDKMNASFENYKRLTTNAFSTVTERAGISVSEMTNNLISNAATIEEWSKNIAILTERGLDEGLIEQLRQAGPEAAETVRNLVNSSCYELNALNSAFEDSTRVAMESMQRELDPAGVTNSAEELIDKVANTILENQAMENALIDKVNAGFTAMSTTIQTAGFDQGGYYICIGIAQGVSDGTIHVQMAVEKVGQQALRTLQNTLEERSPSQATKRMGEFLIDGLTIGMYSKAKEVDKACKFIGSKAMKGMALSAPSLGYAHSSQSNFNRFDYLSSESDNGVISGSPGAAMQKTNSNNYYSGGGGNYGFTYNAAPITIHGGNHSISELKTMIQEIQQEDKSAMEIMFNQFYEERIMREKMYANT